MPNSVLYIAFFITSVFISSLSQVMLKKSADKTHKSLIAEYLNPRVIFAYTLFFLSTLVTVYAFRYVPLSFGPILESLAYVFIGILSVFVLKEKITKKGIIGMIVIIAGVIVFSL